MGEESGILGPGVGPTRGGGRLGLSVKVLLLLVLVLGGFESEFGCCERKRRRKGNWGRGRKEDAVEMEIGGRKEAAVVAEEEEQPWCGSAHFCRMRLQFEAANADMISYSTSLTPPS